MFDPHGDLESLYNGIKANLVARYHQPGNSFPNFTVSDAELTEQAALSSYALHESDGMSNNSLYVDGVHIERLIA